MHVEQRVLRQHAVHERPVRVSNLDADLRGQRRLLLGSDLPERNVPRAHVHRRRKRMHERVELLLGAVVSSVTILKPVLSRGGGRLHIEQSVLRQHAVQRRELRVSHHRADLREQHRLLRCAALPERDLRLNPWPTDEENHWDFSAKLTKSASFGLRGAVGS